MFGDMEAMMKQAKAAAAKTASMVADKAAVASKQLAAANAGPPTAEGSLEKVVQSLLEAQQGLGQAMSFVPGSGPERQAGRKALTDIYESLQQQLERLDKLRNGTPTLPTKPAPTKEYSAPPMENSSYSAPAPKPAPPKPAPPPPAPAFADFGDFSSAPAPAPAPAPAFADFGDFSSAPAPAPPPQAPAKTAEVDLFGDFSAAPSPPTPAASASSDGFGDFGDLLGGGPPVTKSASTGNSLDDMFGLGGGGPPAPRSAFDELTMDAPLMPEGMAVGEVLPEKRLKLPDADKFQHAPFEPEETQSQVEKRVQAWADGKNLQALLASLHTIAPKCCRWEPKSIGELLDEQKLKDAYKLSLVAVHPDKLDNDRPEWEKIRCQLIFNHLRRNRPKSS